MPRISKSERVEFWLDRLERHSQSGQTIAQFCVAEGVSAPSFYHWKRRLGLRLAEKRETQMSLSDRKPAAFSEIQIVGLASPASIRLRGGIQIQLGMDLGIAATIVDRVLQHACGDASVTETEKSKSC